MKTSIKIAASLFVLSLFTLSSCKKTGPAGETGPVGPQGSQGPVINLTSAGSITGTITGKRKDGVSFTEPFSYTYYFPNLGGGGTLDSLGTSNYSFLMSRSTNDIFSNDQASIQINTTSKTATTGISYLNVTFEKSLGSNKFFSFSTSSSAISTTTLSYNTSTGALSGNINTVVSGGNNTTTYPATITCNYSSDIMQRVYRLANTSGTKAH